MSDRFQKQREALDAIANLCLAGAETPQKWLPEDLVNAGLVLNNVAVSLAWIRLSDLPIEQSELIAQEFGKNLRQSLHLFTGYDVAELVKAGA